MRIVTFKLSEAALEEIDRLVREGKYASRSEFIRIAVYEKLQRERSSGSIERPLASQHQRSKYIVRVLKVEDTS
ncbi:MAG: hypothetical protein DRH17_13625 [Deltaproteobacteria bacterium]|nr:MAG: hypothetical protein DRH17_13625 [Deltaproteobacteria bacterium]